MTVHLGVFMKCDIRDYVKQTWHDTEEQMHICISMLTICNKEEGDFI